MTFYTTGAMCRRPTWRCAISRPPRSPAGHRKLLVNDAALDQLHGAAPRVSARPLIVLSAYRSPSTTATSAAPRRRAHRGYSLRHRHGDHDPEAFEAAARAVGFQGLGLYPRSGFIQIDLGPARSWGNRFPKRPTAFAAETPPAARY